MKKIWREITSECKFSPITPWIKQGETLVVRNTEGHITVFIEVDGVVMYFNSVVELEHVKRVFQNKNLPSTLELSSQSPWNGSGPNGHWLSRLPADAKSWKYRENWLKFVKKNAEEIQKLFT